MSEKSQLVVDSESLERAMTLYPLKPSDDRKDWLERQHELFLLLFNNIRDGVMVTMPQGEITAVNAAAASILGLNVVQCKGRQFLQMFCTKSGKSWSERLTRLLESKGEIRSLRTFMMSCKEDRRTSVEIDVSPLRTEGMVARYLVIIRDRTVYDDQCRVISDQMKALRETAMTDALTGLYNRRWLYKAFGSFVGRAQREGTDLCSIFIDLDKFKQINDRISYWAGDQVLIRVSNALRASLRAEDAIVRLGGDEFLIIMVMQRHESFAISYRLLEAVTAITIPNNEDENGEPIVPGGVTASIGMFVLDSSYLIDFDARKPWSLIREVVGRAEAAKKNVKDNGRNGIHLFSPRPPNVVDSARMRDSSPGSSRGKHY